MENRTSQETKHKGDWLADRDKQLNSRQSEDKARRERMKKAQLVQKEKDHGKKKTKT
jgi:hypothetical protein